MGANGSWRFDLTGALAEAITFGLQDLVAVGMGTFVYGLMIDLPAATVPEERGARNARWRAWAIAVFLPIIFVIPFTLWLVWRSLSAGWGWATRSVGSPRSAPSEE